MKAALILLLASGPASAQFSCPDRGEPKIARALDGRKSDRNRVTVSSISLNLRFLSRMGAGEPTFTIEDKGQQHPGTPTCGGWNGFGSARDTWMGSVLFPAFPNGDYVLCVAASSEDGKEFKDCSTRVFFARAGFTRRVRP